MKELRELRRELEAVVEPDGRASVDWLFGLLEKQVGRCDRLEKENTCLRLRILELEQKLHPPATKQVVPTKAYSLDAEERRRRTQRRRKADSKRKPGRKPKKGKLDGCVRWVDILPDRVRKKDCDDCNERPVWHIKNGQAVRVGFRIHRSCGKIHLVSLAFCRDANMPSRSMFCWPAWFTSRAFPSAKPACYCSSFARCRSSL